MRHKVLCDNSCVGAAVSGDDSARKDAGFSTGDPLRIVSRVCYPSGAPRPGGRTRALSRGNVLRSNESQIASRLLRCCDGPRALALLRLRIAPGAFQSRCIRLRARRLDRLAALRRQLSALILRPLSLPKKRWLASCPRAVNSVGGGQVERANSCSPSFPACLAWSSAPPPH